MQCYNYSKLKLIILKSACIRILSAIILTFPCLPGTLKTRIGFYSIAGSHLFNADNSDRNAGHHEIMVNLSALNLSETGIMIIRFDLGGSLIYKRVVLLEK